jgi:hypothetical protein
VEGLLSLGDLRHGQGDARGPGADDVFHAVGVDGLLGAARGAARLGLVVARDVLDGLALDLHAALVEGHLHAAVEDRAHVGEGTGEGPEAEHGNLFLLGPEHSGKGKSRRRGGAAQLEHVPSSEFAHRGSSSILGVRCDRAVRWGENRPKPRRCQVGASGDAL